MNPITRTSISELVSFRSLIGFGEAATELQTFKNCKNYKEMCMVTRLGTSVPTKHTFLCNLCDFGKLLLVQYLTKPFETL